MNKRIEFKRKCLHQGCKWVNTADPVRLEPDLLNRGSVKSLIKNVCKFLALLVSPVFRSSRHMVVSGLSSHMHFTCDTHIQPFSHAHMQTNINLVQFKTFLSRDCWLVQATKSTGCASFRVLIIDIM